MCIRDSRQPCTHAVPDQVDPLNGRLARKRRQKFGQSIPRIRHRLLVRDISGRLCRGWPGEEDRYAIDISVSCHLREPVNRFLEVCIEPVNKNADLRTARAACPRRNPVSYTHLDVYKRQR